MNPGAKTHPQLLLDFVMTEKRAARKGLKIGVTHQEFVLRDGKNQFVAICYTITELHNAVLEYPTPRSRR